MSLNLQQTTCTKRRETVRSCSPATSAAIGRCFSTMGWSETTPIHCQSVPWTQFGIRSPSERQRCGKRSTSGGALTLPKTRDRICRTGIGILRGSHPLHHMCHLWMIPWPSIRSATVETSERHLSHGILVGSSRIQAAAATLGTERRTRQKLLRSCLEWKINIVVCMVFQLLYKQGPYCRYKLLQPTTIIVTMCKPGREQRKARVTRVCAQGLC
jgi:hypothetical protein